MQYTPIPHPSNPDARDLLVQIFCEECNELGMIVPNDLRLFYAPTISGYGDLHVIKFPYAINASMHEHVSGYVYDVSVLDPKRTNDDETSKACYTIYIFLADGTMQIRQSMEDEAPLALLSWQMGYQKICIALIDVLTALLEEAKYILNEASRRLEVRMQP